MSPIRSGNVWAFFPCLASIIAGSLTCIRQEFTVREMWPSISSPSLLTFHWAGRLIFCSNDQQWGCVTLFNLGWIQVCTTPANELNSSLADLEGIWGGRCVCVGGGGGSDVILQTDSDREGNLLQFAVRSWREVTHFKYLITQKLRA